MRSRTVADVPARTCVHRGHSRRIRATAAELTPDVN